ncbi:hypothetical protein ACS0TY_034461 [Phlomoides rotata]
MEYPWRSRPPVGNFCPVCSHPHFPFCPPPPLQFSRPPPPPPDQFFHTPPPSYDPFVDHQGPPTVNPYLPLPPTHIRPQPWNANHNFSKDYYINSNPGLGYDDNGQIGVKRMRLDNVNGGFMAEDERRLKLIRDHGAVTHGLDGHIIDNKNVEFGRSLHNQNESILVRDQGYGNSIKRPRGNHETLAYDDAAYQEWGRSSSTESRVFNNQFLQSHATQQHRMEPKSPYYSPNQSDNVRLLHDPQGFKAQPPLPTSPPPPLPVEPPRFRFSEPVVSSPASGPGSMFRVSVDSASSFQSPYTMVSEAPNSSGYYSQEIQAVRMASSKIFNGESEGFGPRSHSLDKPKVIDASHILKHPHRVNRPDHIVIILRGLPGSGKSYLAKILRDLEVENGGTAPRIHSMDEYFMAEVEKVEENEGSRSSGSVRGKKPVVKKVMEYCYEPDMEEAYRSSMLKAFKKTLDDGAFPFVIVDDRNLRVADFAQFWATAKRSGYEVYLLEATYKDPVGCAARNVHGFTQSEIQDMGNQWEEAPSLYMKLDIKLLLHGDDLEENGIEEVDMDTEDGNHISDPSGSVDANIQKVPRPSEGDLASDGPSIDEKKGDGAEESAVEVMKELGKSKWSNDLEDDDAYRTEVTQGNSSTLSSLTKSYRKKGKSVRWGDQIGRIGFSIGAGKNANVSLVIGPGSGYNSKSNPLPEEEKLAQRHSGESRRQNIFQEQLRAERESFRAVFDKRKHRINGLVADDE